MVKATTVQARHRTTATTPNCILCSKQREKSKRKRMGANLKYIISQVSNFSVIFLHEIRQQRIFFSIAARSIHRSAASSQIPYYSKYSEIFHIIPRSIFPHHSKNTTPYLFPKSFLSYQACNIGVKHVCCNCDTGPKEIVESSTKSKAVRPFEEVLEAIRANNNFEWSKCGDVTNPQCVLYRASDFHQSRKW